MDNPLLLQKQIKDNTEDLHNFVRDLKLWEEEMKRKDRLLSNEKSEEVLPPVRRLKLSHEAKVKKKEDIDSKSKRIPSHDYKSWEKFDVDKACEEIDNEDSQNGNDEENNEESAQEEEKYLKEKALYEKELGNQHVKASRWDKAIESYTRAISAYSRDPIFFANRALCYLKKKQYGLVEADCTESLKLDSTYVKALMRRAAAREALGRLEDARHDLTQALQLEPNNSQAMRDLARVKAAVASGNKSFVSEIAKEENIANKNSNDKFSFETTTNLVSSPIKETKDIAVPVSKKVTIKELSNEHEWPTQETTVEPIFKPPHLRSNKSLKRIEILDVDMNSANHETCNKLQKPETPPVVQQGPKLSEEKKSTVSPSPKQKSIFTMSTPESSRKTLPPLPKTSVQFNHSWNSIKNDRNMCFQFLKQIPGDNLPDIFKESLESGMFSSIVQILVSEFIPANEPVMQYLRGLSQVRRFSTIVLFMSSTDKSNLSTLLGYCSATEKCSQGDIEELRRIYEVFE